MRTPISGVFLHDRSWSEFEILLAVRGDRAGLRMFYLEGEIELMSPSESHEGIKTTIARLKVEAYADDRGARVQRLWLVDPQERTEGARGGARRVLRDRSDEQNRSRTWRSK